MSIAVFDSGFGGLSVMRALQELLPQENYIYYGDTARLPYGNRSPETIRRFCLESISFLQKKEIKLLVIACNSACTCAFEEVQKISSVPVIGVVEPGVQAVTALKNVQSIAILGTRATIASGVHAKLLKQRLPEASILQIACPLFVPLVEEGYVDHPLTKMVIHEYARPLLEQGVDTVLLACTHYSLLENALQRELGEDVRLIDPSRSAALEVKRTLEVNQLLNTTRTPLDQFFVSDDGEKFRFFGTKFLRKEIQIVSEII